MLYDLSKDKVIVGESEKDLMPIASVSKLMTAYVSLKLCRDDLKKDLNKILIESDNVAADYIAENCPNTLDFIEKMNYYVKLNSLNMNFKNPTGLDINDETEASNFGDALSVAKLINILHKENSSLLYHTTNNFFQGLKNTNEYASSFPFLVGSKTGYTDMAGGNLATLFEIGPEDKISIVVLGSTKEERFSDVKYILFEYLKYIK